MFIIKNTILLEEVLSNEQLKELKQNFKEWKFNGGKDDFYYFGKDGAYYYPKLSVGQLKHVHIEPSSVEELRKWKLKWKYENKGSKRQLNQSPRQNRKAPAPCDVSRFRPIPRESPDTKIHRRHSPASAPVSVSARAAEHFAKQTSPAIRRGWSWIPPMPRTTAFFCAGIRRRAATRPAPVLREIYARKLRTRWKVSTPARFLRVPPPAPARPPCNESPMQSSSPWRIRPAGVSWPRRNGWLRRPDRYGKCIW